MFCYPAVVGYHAVSAMLLFRISSAVIFYVRVKIYHIKSENKKDVCFFSKENVQCIFFSIENV